ncbi:hypothetical protein LZ31DRAFT_257798 [Colletotrichum somersetense]|nr:hypothetical protein LZ31DRAFT_257798 [Colletotrichum somersetense]
MASRSRCAACSSDQVPITAGQAGEPRRDSRTVSVVPSGNDPLAGLAGNGHGANHTVCYARIYLQDGYKVGRKAKPNQGRGKERVSCNTQSQLGHTCTSSWHYGYGSRFMRKTGMLSARTSRRPYPSRRPSPRLPSWIIRSVRLCVSRRRPHAIYVKPMYVVQRPRGQEAHRG